MGRVAFSGQELISIRLLSCCQELSGGGGDHITPVWGAKVLRLPPTLTSNFRTGQCAFRYTSSSGPDSDETKLGTLIFLIWSKKVMVILHGVVT